MKKKVLIIAIMFMLISVTGITYSLYTNIMKKSVPISLASFSVGVEKIPTLDIDLSDLEPGSVNRYNFSILNNIDEEMSDVAITYNIVLKTGNYIPLDIKLYDSSNNLLFDSNNAVRTNDELLLKTNDITMPYSKNVKNDYSLVVEFPEEFDGEEYSGLVDYINLTIEASQKIN